MAHTRIGKLQKEILEYIFDRESYGFVGNHFYDSDYRKSAMRLVKNGLLQIEDFGFFEGPVDNKISHYRFVLTEEGFDVCLLLRRTDISKTIH